MKIEISSWHWSVIKDALVENIEDYRNTALLDTATEGTREILLKAAERREQVLNYLKEQLKDYENKD